MPTINQFEVSDLPQNRMIVTTDGVTHIEAKKIKFSEIVEPLDELSRSQNTARVGDVDAKHIADLRYSFKDGVNIWQPLPSVEILKTPIEHNGVIKKYRLLDGHHRVAALWEDVDEYVFDVYEIDTHNEYKSRITFQLKSNKHAPSKKSSDKSIIVNASLLLQRGDFNDASGNFEEDLIDEWLCEVHNLQQGVTQRKSSLITKVMERNGVHQIFKDYPDKESKRWILANLPQCKLHEHGGHWWIFKTGTTHRSLMTLLQKDTSDVQYVILNPVTTGGDVIKSRKNLNDSVESLWVALCDKMGVSDYDHDHIFKIVYALPQITETEDMDRPISLEIKELESV